MSRSSPIELVAIGMLVTSLPLGCRQDMHDQHKVEPLERSAAFLDGRSARHSIDGTVARGELRTDQHLHEGKMRLTDRGTGGAPSEPPSVEGGAGGAPATEGTGGGAGGGESTVVEGESASADDLAEEAPMAPDPIAQADTTDVADTFPYPIALDDLKRGRERYDIFCSPCHARTGDGDGMVVRRGFRRPPSLHIERLREAKPGHFFDVIANGFGAMPAYGKRMSVRDAWAIVAYIRALQLSQNARLDELTDAMRAELEARATELENSAAEPSGGAP